MKIVFDASTLILLAKIELLREISGDIKIIIPKRVESECLAKEGMDAKLIAMLIKEKLIEVQTVKDEKAVMKVQRDFRIEAGEAEALCLSMTLSCPLAVDDGPTIKVCKVLGHGFTTAVHFLLDVAARKKLSIPIAVAKFEKLSSCGRYSKRIIEDAMNRLKGGQ